MGGASYAMGVAGYTMEGADRPHTQMEGLVAMNKQSIKSHAGWLVAHYSSI